MATPNPFKFVGPAGQEFSSLQEQATYYLDTHMPYWRSYDENAESYSIPPAFSFTNPAMTDEVIQKLQRNDVMRLKWRPTSIRNHRSADEAEYVVFTALHQVIQTRIKAPFIAVKGLDLRLNKVKGLVKGILPTIFPHLLWDDFVDRCGLPAELDFILIGPKTGIIAIEVKSSNFILSKHFAKGNEYLPVDYKNGLKQLQKANELFSLLSEITQMPSDGFPIRKILVTPNLHRSRYEAWLETLGVIDKHGVVDKIGDVVQWFHEDIFDSDQASDQQLIYGNLCKLFENACTIPFATYEAYTAMLTAFATMDIIGVSTERAIRLKEERLSETAVIENTDVVIASHNPLLHDTSYGRIKPSFVAKTPKSLQKHVLFLTPDQIKALKGPNRQFLLGAPGTGKTLLLQFKAFELLEAGASILILTPKSYMLHYQILFDSKGYQHYTICCWIFDKIKEIYHKIEEEDGRPLSDIDITQRVYDFVQRELKKSDCTLLEYFPSFLTNDHIFIDDAFDQEANKVWAGSFFIGPLLVMALASLMAPRKVVWVAMDPYTGYGIGYAYRKHGYNKIITELLNSIVHPDERYSYYHVTVLKHVMRCSESIFKAAFSPKMEWRPETTPVPGHKFVGMEVITVTASFPSYGPALNGLWRKVKTIIARFIKGGQTLAGVALIVGTFPELDTSVCRYLRKKCAKYWPVHCIAKLKLDNLELKPRRGVSINFNSLTVDDWNSVSSLEWPIVIYASCLPTDLDETDVENVTYQRYRAMTRARAKLIDVGVTYNRNILTDEEEAFENEASDDDVKDKEKKPGAFFHQKNRPIPKNTRRSTI